MRYAILIVVSTMIKVCSDVM